LQALLKDEGVSAMSLESADAGALESLRSRLVAKLPASADLAHLRVWPWVPWWPWWDCSPDIIFRARQQCGGTELTTIVDESISNTRWDIPTRLDVTLVAKESACCLPGTCEEPPCPGGECLVVDKVCEIPLAQVGGNVGAPAAPAGYALPGSVAPGTQAYDGDRPFGGNLSISKNPGDLVGVDYLELEMLAGMSWVPLPMGAELAFSREYLVFPSTTIFPNFPAQTLSGHRVWETREHFQAASGAAWWPAAGASRAWLSYNYSLLGYLDTSKFSDGTYRFRAVGWNDGGGGTLVNRRVIPICGSEKDNEFVLTFDNRVVTHVGHNPAHNCGTVHTCTLEPDTHILDVRINGASVLPCDTVGAAGSLEIDFEVTDPDAHLAVYSLIATWGLNSSKSLLPMGTITALTSGAFTGPTYGEALGQGATAPLWSGGRYRLTVADAAKVFEEPCCYQLELRAWKRTIVNCYGG
jgi:hypothetical protein